MSEKPATYKVTTSGPLAPSVLKRRACCLPITNSRYRQPNRMEIEAVIEHIGCTQSYFAQFLGVASSSRGSSTVRRWLTSAESGEGRGIPYAAWRLSLVESGIVESGKALNDPD